MWDILRATNYSRRVSTRMWQILDNSASNNSGQKNREYQALEMLRSQLKWYEPQLNQNKRKDELF